MSTLQDVLKRYDNPSKKRFSEINFTRELDQLPEKYWTHKEFRSEYLAFSFMEDAGQEHWGTFYGPFMEGEHKDSGELILRPDIKNITAYDISYWESRASASVNPLMKMRYLGLVYDFKKKITGHSPSFKDIIRPYIEVIIQVVSERYHEHDHEGYCLMERALDISIQVNALDLFEQAQEVLWDYDHQVGDDNSPGLWGRHFKLMLKYLDRYGRYESKLVLEHEECFNRIEKLILDGGDSIDLLKDQCELLCDYYQRRGIRDKIVELMNRMYSAIKPFIMVKGGVWAHGMIQSTQALYRKYHLYKEAKRLFTDIQDLGQSALESMTEHRFSLPINKENLDAFIEDFLSGTPREIFEKYLFENIPNIAIERQKLKEREKQDPLSYLCNTVIFDFLGYPISNIGTGKDSEHQKLMYEIYQGMILQAIYLKIEVDKMRENNVLSKEVVFDAFKGSPLMLEEQRGIFERGIEAYFEGDYIVACHLLVPLFEAAIRQLVALCEGEILRPSKDPSKGNEYISLEGLLNSDRVREVLEEDIQMYFKNLFTEQSGWNLRNRISHGLLSTDQFNSVVADRVFHAFCLLSLIKLKDKEVG